MFPTLTKRDKTGLFFLFLTGVSSLFVWKQVFILVFSKGETSPFLPFVWCVLLAVSFFIGSLLWKYTLLRCFAVLLVIVPSFFLFFDWKYIVVSMGVSLLLYRSSYKIFLEENECVHFNFFRSVQAGSLTFFFSITLLFSLGYYTSLQDVVWQEKIPNFRISQGMMKSIFKVIGIVNPSFSQLKEENSTVDEFLLDIEKQQNIQAEVPTVFPKKEGEISPLLVGISPDMQQQLFLMQGRKQISSFVGRQVDGSEKMSDILSPFIQDKLTAFFQSEQILQHLSSQKISIFISFLLFITLFSFVSFLSPLSFYLAYGIFYCMLQIKILAFETVSVEQQKLQK